MIEEKSMMGSIVPYYGGKRSLAPEIVAELGPHAAYFEPFCGSMAVLLAKPKSQQETVCDLNDRLVNLSRCLASSELAPAIYRYLRRVVAAEKLYIRSMTDDPGEWIKSPDFDLPKIMDADAEDACRYFLESWLGRNGHTGSARQGVSFSVRYTPGGGSQATRWRHAVDSIPSFRRRLRDVTILCRDAFEVIESIDDHPQVAVYCDPPYLVCGDAYLHPFADDDHARLAKALHRFAKSRVVVSYYDHPLLDELYPSSQWLKRKFVRHKNLSNQDQHSPTGEKCTEVLLINGNSFARREPLAYGLFGD